MQWWIGDLWNIRQQNGWGDGPEFAEEIGVDYDTARNYGNIAAQVQLSLRRDNLSFSHHKEVAWDDNKEELLSWASKNKASVAKLRSHKKQKQQTEMLPTEFLGGQPLTT